MGDGGTNYNRTVRTGSDFDMQEKGFFQKQINNIRSGVKGKMGFKSRMYSGIFIG